MNEALGAIRAIILSNTTLAASLTVEGVVKVRRGYAGEMDRLPYVLLWVISERPYHHLHARTEARIATVQVDVYAESGAQAGTIAKSIADTIAAFDQENADTVTVLSIMEQDTRVNDQRDREGAESPVCVIQTDYQIVFTTS